MFLMMSFIGMKILVSTFLSADDKTFNTVLTTVMRRNLLMIGSVLYWTLLNSLDSLSPESNNQNSL